MAEGACADLVVAAAAGDQEAWNSLVKQFSGLVWSIARSHRLNAADAADVSQTVWLRLVENLDRIREPERVGAWVATTARNECLRVIRRSGRQVPTDLEQETDEVVDIATPAPEAGLLAGERDRELWAAFGRLGPRCQALLRLLMTDPPTPYDEISAALDMRVGSIGPTRARCLKHLRDRIGITGAASGSG